MDAHLKPENLETWTLGTPLGAGYALEKDSKVSIHFAKLVSTTDFEDTLSHELGVCHSEVLVKIRCTLLDFKRYLEPKERAVVDHYAVKWQQKCIE